MRSPVLTGAVSLVLLAGYALAGPERVAFPKGYDTAWIKYTVVERPDRKIVRNMFVNPEAHAKAKAGQPIPDGTVLVMEDMKVKLDASGSPELNSNGRFVPNGEIRYLRHGEAPGVGCGDSRRQAEWRLGLLFLCA
jgi:hypothetical protein